MHIFSLPKSGGGGQMPPTFAGYDLYLQEKHIADLLVHVENAEIISYKMINMYYLYRNILPTNNCNKQIL